MAELPSVSAVSDEGSEEEEYDKREVAPWSATSLTSAKSRLVSVRILAHGSTASQRLRQFPHWSRCAMLGPRDSENGSAEGPLRTIWGTWDPVPVH